MTSKALTRERDIIHGADSSRILVWPCLSAHKPTFTGWSLMKPLQNRAVVHDVPTNSRILTHLILALHVFIAGKTLYFSTASATADSSWNGISSRSGCCRRYMNAKSTSKTPAGSDSVTGTLIGCIIRPVMTGAKALADTSRFLEWMWNRTGFGSSLERKMVSADGSLTVDIPCRIRAFPPLAWRFCAYRLDN